MPLRWLLALLALAAGAHCPASAAEAVGRVSFRLGEAWIVAADGTRRPADVDAPIHSGDSLETAASGHAHIRFVDGALVSVRPGTRLVVADYRDPGATGAIRFRLEHGQMRSITGRWGEAERSRFRLNTPIAAIGIAGTDFVVHTDAERTRVSVESGAIVAAPFDNACRPEDLGPCATPAARLLTAAMAQQVLEIRRDQPAPILVPHHGRPPGAQAVDSLATPPAEEKFAQKALHASLSAPPLPPPPPTLVWGHWAHAPLWPGDATAPSTAVGAGRERIAENVRYVLYRLPQTDPLPTGKVDLTLGFGQAHLQRIDAIHPAQVREGRLSLDFAARRFDTALTLDAALTGPVPLAASGPIRPDGSFGLIELQTRVQGAWGSGGAQPGAAYLFEHTTPQGVFMGITQWR